MRSRIDARDDSNKNKRHKRWGALRSCIVCFQLAPRAPIFDLHFISSLTPIIFAIVLWAFSLSNALMSFFSKARFF